VRRVWDTSWEEKYLFLKIKAVLLFYKPEFLSAQLFISNCVTVIKESEKQLVFTNAEHYLDTEMRVISNTMPSPIPHSWWLQNAYLEACQTVMPSDITKRNKTHLPFITLVYTTTSSSVKSLLDFATFQNPTTWILGGISSIHWEVWRLFNRRFGLLFIRTVSLPWCWQWDHMAIQLKMEPGEDTICFSCTE